MAIRTIGYLLLLHLVQNFTCVQDIMNYFILKQIILLHLRHEKEVSRFCVLKAKAAFIEFSLCSWKRKVLVIE